MSVDYCRSKLSSRPGSYPKSFASVLIDQTQDVCFDLSLQWFYEHKNGERLSGKRPHANKQALDFLQQIERVTHKLIVTYAN